MIVRAATEQDFEKFYGPVWTEMAMKMVPKISVSGVVIEDQGTIVGVGGVIGEKRMIFSDIIPGFHNARAIMRAARLLFRLCPGSLVAERNEEIDTSARFLAHLGFRPAGDVWVNS